MAFGKKIVRVIRLDYNNRVLSEALKKLEGELREVRQKLEERVAEKEAEIERLNQKMQSASQAITKAQEKVVQADADLKENSEERKQLLSRYCHYINSYFFLFALKFGTEKNHYCILVSLYFNLELI